MKKLRWITMIVLASFLLQGIMSMELRAQEGSKNADNKKAMLLTSTMDQANGQILLTDLLSTLERHFDVTFLYKDEVVMNKYVNPIKIGEETGQELSWVLDRLGLVFQQIDEQTYVLLRKTPSSQATPVQEEISGTVTDAQTGETLPGVNVLVKGTTTGTSTDSEGTFELTVESLQDTLVFSFVGYQTQEVPVNGQTEINVALQSQAIAGEELVVVGYGTQEDVNVTGSVSSVSEDKINDVSTGDAVSKLRGRVSGVQITEDYSPGGNSVVRIRGVGTVNSNEPLYVVDGVPVNDLDGINPDAIESMSVLKDAASAAIYGSRAANGVIVVTTKRGEKEQDLSVNFRAQYGVQQVRNTFDMLNAQELGELKWLEQRNDGLEPGDAGWGDPQYGNGAEPVIPDYVFPAGAMEGEVDESNYNHPRPYYGITRSGDTDWQDEIFHVAPSQDYNLTLSGGNDYANFSVTAGYEDQSGIMIHTGYKQYNLRANADFEVNNWLDVGQSLGGIYSERRGTAGATGGEGEIFNALRISPILPVYDIQGNFAGTKSEGTSNSLNPVANLYRDRNDFSKQIRLLTNTYARISLSETIEIETTLGVDLENNRYRDYTLMDPEFTQTNYGNSLSEDNDRLFQYNWINTVTYDGVINEDHTFNVLVASELVKNNTDGFGASRSSYAFENTDFMVLDAGESNINNEGVFDEWALFSYFGRINYNYKDKYLFEGVIRRDGSSRFADEHRWGTFPAFSIGWRLLEDFGNISFIDELKIRVGWGQNGNDNVGNYNQYSTYEADPNLSYYPISGSNTGSEAGFWQNRIGNSEAKWETNTTTNIGVDFAFLDYRFEGSVDVYQRKTTDMLYPDRRPAVLGEASTPDINIGEMKNTGIDLMLSYQGGQSSDFTYNIDLNFSHYKNEVIKLLDDPEEFRYGNLYLNDPYTITKAGVPVSSFYGWIVEGYFNTEQEIEEHPPFNPDAQGNDSYSRLGVFKYKDTNGDGVITSDDRTIIGSPHPDFTYGLNFDFQYKSWDMTVFFQGSQGNEIMNYRKRQMMFNRYDGNFLADRLYNSWTQERYENGETITAPITTNNDGTQQRPSTWFLEDGSYLKLKNFQIGYTLPNQISSRMQIQNLRIYLQATNLFTITNYSGLDPELSTSDDLSSGVDSGLYPPSRVISMGLNLNF